MGLASLPGKLDEYLDLERDGLTTLELDVKDENGEIGFMTRSVPLAVSIGAARDYFEARDVVRRAHERGIYLIGRVVVFEDPVLSRARPRLAIRRADGSVWRDAAGLGWTNPYDRRVWKYNADVAAAAARAGFDEIMFDYVRFPSDGDVDSAVYGRSSISRREAVPAFLRYAKSRLEPYDVRISAAVFGLSAARDLGIGQLPRQMAPYLDTVYAMTYPSLFGAGELGLQDPSTAPGATVARALRRFELSLRGREVLVVPWVQDFSFSVPYGLDEVRAQIDAARISGAKGYLLWNPEGLYTDGALAPPSWLGREALAAPAVYLANVAQPVVEPVVAVRPQLDRVRDDAVPAPERGKRDRAFAEPLLDVAHPPEELRPVFEHLRLRRRPGCDLAPSRSRLPVRRPTPPP